MAKKTKVLILSPHPDDIELSMGATIRKMVKKNLNIYSVVFSPAISSNPEGIIQYIPKAYGILGLSKYSILGYELRKFSYSRQDILDKMIEIRNTFNPDIVFIPCSKDIHQDHEVIHKEGIRAFENRTLLGYSYRSQGNLFVKVNEKEIEAKISAANCYLPQRYKSYFSKNYIKSKARFDGMFSNSEYAESFETIKIVI